MARRDRRRGGAHSAKRKSSRSSGSPASAPLEEIPAETVDRTTASGLLSPGGPDPGPAQPVAELAGSEPGPPAPLSRAERRAATQTKRRPARKKPKRSWLDRVLIAGVVVVALALVAMGSGYAYLQYRFDQVAKVTVKHLKTAPVGQPFNVLLIGSDSRADVSSTDQSHLGSEATAGGQRSDVVKIVHVIPASGQVRVLSIPRDTMVTVAGNTDQTGTYNRINATFGTGPDQLVQTIEADFGIPIEHTVQIDFEGFRGAVDAIGGINLNFPYPARDAYTGLNIVQPGCQHLNGGYSLAVARSRHYEYEKNGYWQSDGTSDFGRIQRQNAFLKALINQAETRYNPLTINAFIGSVVQGVTVDSTFTVSDLISLARQFHTFASQSLQTATLPTYSAYSSRFASYGDVLYVQEPQAGQVVNQFLGDTGETTTSPPPGPYGVATTTTTAPSTGSSQTTPGTSTSSSTTTTIETDFDPTPC